VLMRKKDGALSCHVGVCACSHACALARQCSHACHIIDQVVDEGDLAGRILGLSVWFGNPQTSGRVLWVFKSSGNENYYPMTAKKTTTCRFRYPQIWVWVRVYPIYPKYIKSQQK
jgi:hypothetical protein